MCHLRKVIVRDWNDEERDLHRRVLAGETVVYDRHKHGPHARFREWVEKQELSVYIGRRDPYGRWSQSDWHNPYTVKKHGLGEALRLYEEGLLKNSDLRARIPELKGRALACWCKPYRCHGDILARLANSIGTSR
jgi:hypothetical protein